MRFVTWTEGLLVIALGWIWVSSAAHPWWWVWLLFTVYWFLVGAVLLIIALARIVTNQGLPRGGLGVRSQAGRTPNSVDGK
jgi:biotin transporter BioY